MLYRYPSAGKSGCIRFGRGLKADEGETVSCVRRRGCEEADIGGGVDFGGEAEGCEGAGEGGRQEAAKAVDSQTRSVRK